jgi:cytochrome c5
MWIGLVLAVGAVSVALAAVEPDKKRGRLYYRMVCTACHAQNGGQAISPNARTIAEWKAYFDADKHDKSGKTNASVQYFTSQKYRASVKDSNKAADKFLSLPDEQLLADVRAFEVSGAKDSDTPARCQ